MNSSHDELIQAYTTTHYHVSSNPPFVLKVGEKSKELELLYKQKNVNSAVFITAYNPYSQQLTVEENTVRNQSLLNDMANMQFDCIEGYGEHPSGNWSRELSFLVLGMSSSQADEIAKKYEQNAFIWCGSDSIPNLNLTNKTLASSKNRMFICR